MKKLITVILAVAAVVFAVSCKKDNGKQGDGRPVCTKIVFTVNSTGYSKEILDLFRINISGIDFNGEAFSSNWVAEYNATFTVENVCIDSAEGHCPFTIKVDVEKRGEPDPEASYAFPHTFYFQAEYYDAAGNKLDVCYGPLSDEKIDRFFNSNDDGITIKGDSLEEEVRFAVEADQRTYVFFRSNVQDTFGCTIKM